MGKFKPEDRAAIDQRWLKSPVKECHYCGVLLSKSTATKEHVIPKSSGGKNTPSNIVFSCRACNGERGSGDYAAFKASKLEEKQARRRAYASVTATQRICYGHIPVPRGINPADGL